MHRLLLGPSLSVHVTCHYHLIPTTPTSYTATTDLLYKWAMYVCVCLCIYIHAPHMHLKHTAEMRYILWWKEVTIIPWNLKGRAKKYLREKASSFTPIMYSIHVQWPVLHSLMASSFSPTAERYAEVTWVSFSCKTMTKSSAVLRQNDFPNAWNAPVGVLIINRITGDKQPDIPRWPLLHQ